MKYLVVINKQNRTVFFKFTYLSLSLILATRGGKVLEKHYTLNYTPEQHADMQRPTQTLTLSPICVQCYQFAEQAIQPSKHVSIFSVCCTVWKVHRNMQMNLYIQSTFDRLASASTACLCAHMWFVSKVGCDRCDLGLDKWTLFSL